MSHAISDSYFYVCPPLSESEIETHSGWHLYQSALVKANIKQQVQQWYAHHVKRFIHKFTGIDLNTLTEPQIENHLETIPSDWFKHDWQHIQYIDAIGILLTDVLHTPWAADFSWADYASTAKTLSINHHTIAREAHNNTTTLPVFSTKHPLHHEESLQSLSLSLRENRKIWGSNFDLAHMRLSSLQVILVRVEMLVDRDTISRENSRISQ